MQYSQEHLKTMVYAKFGGQTECIMGNWKIENRCNNNKHIASLFANCTLEWFYLTRKIGSRILLTIMH